MYPTFMIDMGSMTVDPEKVCANSSCIVGFTDCAVAWGVNKLLREQREDEHHAQVPRRDYQCAQRGQRRGPRSCGQQKGKLPVFDPSNTIR